MLEYEDCLIDMQILNYNEENFKEFEKKFNSKTYPKLKKTYLEILALFLMFLENRKYADSKDFERDLKQIQGNKVYLDKELKNNKNIPKKFLKSCKDIEEFFEKNKKVETFEISKEFFKDLDVFNTQIPDILTLRRDHMK